MIRLGNTYKDCGWDPLEISLIIFGVTIFSVWCWWPKAKMAGVSILGFYLSWDGGR